MQRAIIAGVDRSARSRAAAEWATREALLRGVPLRVVHVVPPASLDPVEQWPYRPQAVAEHVVAELVERHPALSARGESFTGEPAPVLCASDGPPQGGLRRRSHPAGVDCHRAVGVMEQRVGDPAELEAEARAPEPFRRRSPNTRLRITHPAQSRPGMRGKRGISA